MNNLELLRKIDESVPMEQLYKADTHQSYSAFQLQEYQHERIPMSDPIKFRKLPRAGGAECEYSIIGVL
ncbi:hypothetical protein [Paenibacillus sp. NPDC055715]